MIIINLDYGVKTYSEQINNSDFSSLVLGVDVGGTNTNLGVAGVKDNSLKFLFSLSFKSKELNSLIPAVSETLTYASNKYDIVVEDSCIGAAGVVSPSQEYVKLTNVAWDVNSEELVQKTPLKSAVIINDFQTIGYGINLLDCKNPNDIFIVKSEQKKNQKMATKSILGAGTGLGKSILTYDEHFDAYIPIPSEGGHSDFPARNSFELELTDFIKKFRNISQPVTYEELLSGRGIESIYMFLKQSGKFIESQYSTEIERSNDKAATISKYRKDDELCAETFKLFTKFYGRCAKNFVLDSLSVGGLYIAGGIAAKNKDIFTTNDFLSEFEDAYRRSEVLKETPIYVINNYDVSLYGACFAAMYNKKKLEGEI